VVHIVLHTLCADGGSQIVRDGIKHQNIVIILETYELLPARLNVNVTSLLYNLEMREMKKSSAKAVLELAEMIYDLTVRSVWTGTSCLPGWWRNETTLRRYRC
jgi:hypothetical protein